MNQFFENLLGANWRTTLTGILTGISGLLTALAALPYELGDIATIIHPDAKPWLLKISGTATLILYVLNAVLQKDRQVAGNGTDSDPNKVPSSNGGNRIVNFILIFLIPCLFTGCLTDGQLDRLKATGAYVGNKAAGIATRVILSAAVSQIDRENKEDFLHSAAQGLRTEMLSIVSSKDIERVMDIWTPDKPHWGELAQEVAELYAETSPRTEAEKKAAIERIAAGLQQATK